MRIGNYEVVRSLATGGMGEVLLARQMGPGGFARAVVVKRLLPHLASQPAFVQMFLNEARVVSRLSHPNIAQIYELGESGATLFLAMEFVHGRSLQVINKRLASLGRALHPALAVRILIEALRGLEHAHSLSIDGRSSPVVHRDVSPDNILVAFNGAVRVIDFGIARAADSASTTRTGTLKGKFSYMAPERFDEERVKDLDAGVDVYSMGVVAYECLAGRKPFRGSSDAALVGAILNTEAEPLSLAAPSVPKPLSDLVHLALEKDRTRRFASAKAFADALETWLDSTGQRTQETELAQFMHTLFGEEANLNPASTIASAPAIELPAPALVSGTSRRPSSRRFMVFAAGLVAVAVAVVATVIQLGTPEVAAPVSVAVVEPTPKPAPPEPARPALTGKPGHVSFRVKPWGEIWLDGQKLGVTPNVRVERPPGQYTFVVKHPDFPSKELPVTVLPESELSVKVDLTTP